MITSRWNRLAIVTTVALGLAPSIAWAGAAPVGASEHLAPVACAPSALTILTWSDFAAYAPATPVALTTILRNSGSVACRVTLGGTSPLLTVRGADGSVAWSSCGVATPCPLYLMVTTLTPGASHVQTWTWNQQTKGVVAPRGTYSVETVASGARSSLANAFRLTARTAQRTVVTDPSGTVRRVTLSRGATLVVRLAGRGLYVWSAPSASPRLATRLSLGGATVLALYVAREAGTAVVRATATPSCYPQCLMPSQLYQLLVTITP
jgi:hypothetical protein